MFFQPWPHFPNTHNQDDITSHVGFNLRKRINLNSPSRYEVARFDEMHIPKRLSTADIDIQRS
jgi:hypothetical protein